MDIDPTTEPEPDTEAHIYVPKDERAGATDTEGHGRWSPDDREDTEGHMPRITRGVEAATEDDTIGDDTEGHGRFSPDNREDTEGHMPRIGRGIETATEDDTLDDAPNGSDTDGHGRFAPDAREDTEGHMPRIGGGRSGQAATAEDDTEGHMPRIGRSIEAATEGDTTGDDTEGHMPRLGSRTPRDLAPNEPAPNDGGGRGRRAP